MTHSTVAALVSGIVLLVSSFLGGCEGTSSQQNASKTHDTCTAVPVDGMSFVIRYPATVIVDGRLNDSAWTDPSVSWQHVGSHHGFFPANSDNDLSFDFAAVADETNLYVAMRVWDDVLHFDANDYPQFDDSIDLFIDIGNEKSSTSLYAVASWKNPGYDSNDGRFTATIDGRTFASRALNPLLRNESLTASLAVPTTHGYNMELTLPLAMPDLPPIALTDGATIGFDVSVNDDDGEIGRPPNMRKAAIQWSNLAAVADLEWRNASLFGVGVFCHIPD